MRALFPAVALIVLAACDTGSTTVDTTVSEDSAAAPAPTATVTQTAAPAMPTPTDTAMPAPLPSATTIPAAIQGRWGLVPADCTSTRGDAKGLLTVEPALLRFYESRGTLKAVKEATDTRIRASFEFSGEGMTWQRDETLDVQDGGKTLIRREYGDDAQPGPFKYARC